MKWFGVLLILSAACLAGLHQKEKFAHRVRDLKQIQAVFTALRAGVAYRFESLPNLLNSVPQNPFAYAWKEAVHQEQEIGKACRRAGGSADAAHRRSASDRSFCRGCRKTRPPGAANSNRSVFAAIGRKSEPGTAEAQNRGRVQLALSVCLGGIVSLLLI